MRRARRESTVANVVLAGYTNSGKSSLLNKLTGAHVLVEDALFATLDPTVRVMSTPHGRQFTLADTVGFVRHLPHQLVDAFRSTLEEVAEADLILHVVDSAAANPEDQISAVREVLAQIGAGGVPELLVANKADIAEDVVLTRLAANEPNIVAVSARTGAGLDELLLMVEDRLPNPGVPVDVVVPFSAGALISRAHSEGSSVDVQYGHAGARVMGFVGPQLAAALTAAQNDRAGATDTPGEVGAS
jgi:GTP-binding protein HflX